MLRDHGQSQKYMHAIEGYNGRLDAIQAGILSVKLRHLLVKPRLVPSARGLVQQREVVRIEVGLLTGGGDRPYAWGLAMALLSKGVCLDFIGSDHLDSPELHVNPKLTFLNLRGDQREDANLA